MRLVTRWSSRVVLLHLPILAFAASARGAAPYPPSPVITGVSYDWGSYKTAAPGSDNWPITWADDGHQYTSWGDGGGFGGTNSDGRVSLGLARVEGPHDTFTGYNVWGGKDPENSAQFGGKSYGIICIGGVLYKWVGPGSNVNSYQEARLCKSTDHGGQWTKASWAFVESDGIIMPTICNFGQDYAGARDNYVYHYFIKLQGSPGSLGVHMPGVIYLLRVDKSKIFGSRSDYEFFAGLDGGGNATWTASISGKQPVFEDPNGVGWCMNVSYNAPLGRYLLSTEHTQSIKGDLGVFDAPEPWGPWTTVIYVSNWESKTSTFYWNFSNKWLSADGKDFVMVFSGTGTYDRWNSVRGSFTATTAPTRDDIDAKIRARRAGTASDFDVKALIKGYRQQ